MRHSQKEYSLSTFKFRLTRQIKTQKNDPKKSLKVKQQFTKHNFFLLQKSHQTLMINKPCSTSEA